jgi:adenylate cyclase class 2
VCRQIGAEDHGEIWQRDTYFEVANGGLKLREERPGRTHLIQFERADEPQQRESRYRIVEVEDGPMLSVALAAAIGVQVVVIKRRRLFLWRDVRIHLDHVERLGRFIELEAVAPPDSDLAREYQLIAELRDMLAIPDERLVAVGMRQSYELFRMCVRRRGNGARSVRPLGFQRAVHRLVDLERPAHLAALQHLG